MKGKRIAVEVLGLVLLAAVAFGMGRVMPWAFPGTGEEPGNTQQLAVATGGEESDPEAAAPVDGADTPPPPGEPETSVPPLPDFPPIADPQAPTIAEMKALSGYAVVLAQHYPAEARAFVEDNRHLCTVLNGEAIRALFHTFVLRDAEWAMSFLGLPFTYNWFDVEEMVQRAAETDFIAAKCFYEASRGTEMERDAAFGLFPVLVETQDPVETMRFFHESKVGEEYKRKGWGSLGPVLEDSHVKLTSVLHRISLEKPFEQFIEFLKSPEMEEVKDIYYLEYLAFASSLPIDKLIASVPTDTPEKRGVALQRLAGKHPKETFEYFKQDPEQLKQIPEMRRIIAAERVMTFYLPSISYFAKAGYFEKLSDWEQTIIVRRITTWNLEEGYRFFEEHRELFEMPEEIETMIGRTAAVLGAGEYLEKLRK